MAVFFINAVRMALEGLNEKKYNSMKICYVGELARTPDAPDHKGIIQGLTWLKEEGAIKDFKIVDPILNNRNEVVRQCNEYGADLVVHGNTDSLTLGIIPEIKAGDQVFFMGDLRLNKEYYHQWSKWIEGSKGLSHLLLSNRTQLEMWSKDFGIPASFWPHGCYVPDQMVFDEAFDKGVVFIGSMIPEYPFNHRIELIKKIQEKLSVPLTLLNGDGTLGRNKIWQDMPKIYHSSKVVLDVSHFWDFDGYASGRYWYTAGLGACSVTKRFPGCDEFYYDTIHKWYFDTADQAADLIHTLLKDDKARFKTKIAAYRQNAANHNYRVRFLQLFEILKYGIVSKSQPSRSS